MWFIPFVIVSVALSLLIGYNVQKWAGPYERDFSFLDRVLIVLVGWPIVLVMFAYIHVRYTVLRGWNAWKNFRQKRKEQKASSQAV